MSQVTKSDVRTVQWAAWAMSDVLSGEREGAMEQLHKAVEQVVAQDGGEPSGLTDTDLDALRMLVWAIGGVVDGDRTMTIRRLCIATSNLLAGVDDRLDEADGEAA